MSVHILCSSIIFVENFYNYELHDIIAGSND